MPKPVREFTREPYREAAPDDRVHAVHWTEETVDIGAAGLFARWQASDDELRMTWETAPEELRDTFRRQFNAGLAAVIAG